MLVVEREALRVRDGGPGNQGSGAAMETRRWLIQEPLLYFNYM
jgi:hypothetical protein